MTERESMMHRRIAQVYITTAIKELLTVLLILDNDNDPSFRTAAEEIASQQSTLRYAIGAGNALDTEDES